jgi:hypothetical protein
LIGPIADAKGVIRKNGATIQLEDVVAELFAKWRFVKIIPVV